MAANMFCRLPCCLDIYRSRKPQLAGLTVFLACRTIEKAEGAKQAIVEAAPGASGAAVPMEVAAESIWCLYMA
eukprot:scaffold143807_cov36-Prasinocladus_malaysianus.AAC.2